MLLHIGKYFKSFTGAMYIETGLFRSSPASVPFQYGLHKSSQTLREAPWDMFRVVVVFQGLWLCVAVLSVGKLLSKEVIVSRH